VSVNSDTEGGDDKGANDGKLHMECLSREWSFWRRSCYNQLDSDGRAERIVLDFELVSV